MKTTLFITAILLIFVSSCTKFLDERPRGVNIPSALNDYEGILDYTYAVNSFPPLLQNQMPDDLDIPTNLVTDLSVNANLYFFRGKVDQSDRDLPAIWADLYDGISAFNLVINEVLSATSGTEEQKRQLFAEAITLRSFNFLALATAFSPAYNRETAGSVYGVPLIQSIDPNVPVPQRIPLDQFMLQLLTELRAAIPYLPASNSTKARPIKEAGYAMISRISLYIGDFQTAEVYADSVLMNQNAKILNYNDYSTVVDMPATYSSSEELLYKRGPSLNLMYSRDLQALYQPTDLRLKLFATSGTDENIGRYIFNPTGAVPTYVPNGGITYAEMFLTKAECLARSGEIQPAMDLINNKIRKNRFTDADYVALTATTTEEAIVQVLNERRRELAFKGVRWLDMKRLDAEGRMSEVKRLTLDGVVQATLIPHAKEYTLQIPLQVQRFNPNIILN